MSRRSEAEALTAQSLNPRSLLQPCTSIHVVQAKAESILELMLKMRVVLSARCLGEHGHGLQLLKGCCGVISSSHSLLAHPNFHPSLRFVSTHLHWHHKLNVDSFLEELLLSLHVHVDADADGVGSYPSKRFKQSFEPSTFLTPTTLTP